MHQSKADQDFLAIAKHHGVELNHDDLAELHRFAWLCNQKSQSRLKDAPPVVYNKGIGRVLLAGVGAALGAFFLPGAIAGLSVLQGALLGAAIGYQLGGLFRRRRRDQAEESPLFEFSSTGELVSLNSPIPTVYASSSTNSDGGILFAQPPTIWSRIFSNNGAQYLRRIVLLSAGQLGKVDANALRLDQQPRSLFSEEDIDVALNLARADLVAPGQVEEYSQAVRLNTNTFIGLENAIEIVSRSIDSVVIDFDQRIDVTTSFTSPPNPSLGIGTITKDASATTGWNAGVQTQSLNLDTEMGSFVGVRFTGEGDDVAGGLSAANPDNALNTIEIGVWLKSNATYEVIQSGPTGTTGAYTNATVFQVRYYRAFPANIVIVIADDREIYRENLTLGESALGDFSLNTPSAIIDNVRLLAHNNRLILRDGIVPGVGRRFLADETELIDPQLIYKYGNTELKIIDRGTGYYDLRPSVFIPESDSIIPLEGATSRKLYGIYRAIYRSSKPVTGLEFTMRLSLYARDKDGELIDHAMAWEIYITKGDGTEQYLYNQFAQSRREKGSRRTIKIKNLPLDYYTVRIEPLTPDQINGSLPKIGDGLSTTTFNTAVSFDGQTAQIEYNHQGTAGRSQIIDLINQQSNDKKITSNEQGPTATLTHCNELVDPTKIGRPAEIRYLNTSTAYSSILASDRIQNAPIESWPIEEGVMCREWLSTAVAVSGSTALQINDVNAHFIDDGVTVGDRVRILAHHHNRVITNVSQVNLSCAVVSAVGSFTSGSAVVTLSQGYSEIREGMPIAGTSVLEGTYCIQKVGANQILIGDEWGWAIPSLFSGNRSLTCNQGSRPDPGDEVVVFSVGSSAYFPDIYVDRLINPHYGLGDYINQDHFVDYPSIVLARRFCINNRFFYEAIVSDGGFESWATDAAPSSLLFVTKINGKYALLPERDDQIKGTFNAGNVYEYSEPYVPWMEQETNTLLLKYSDREGKDKQIKIQTKDSADGIDREIPQTIQLRGVKSQAQAIAVGVQGLNSIRSQNRVCQFSSDIHALRNLQGDLVQTQHVVTQYGNQASGQIQAVHPPENFRTETSPLRVSIMQAIPGANGGTTITTASPHGLQPNDTVELFGSVLAGIYSPTIYESDRFLIQASYRAISGGSVSRRRQVFDQVVVLPGITTLSAGQRISVGSQNAAQVDLEIVNTEDGLMIKGLDREVNQFHLFCLGQDFDEERMWRISAIEPDINSNQIKYSCVLWSRNLGDASNLVVTTF